MTKQIFVFENLNPDGKRIGDCEIRAIAKATGKPYTQIEREIWLALGEVGYRHHCDAGKIYLQKCGYKKLSFPAKKGCPRMTPRAFAESHQKGRYVLSLAGHFTTSVEGQIYDIWDCSDKCVYNAWEIKGG